MSHTFTMPDGRELHFFFSIGAMCDYSDFVLRNPNGDVSVGRAVVRKAVLMNQAYIDANQTGEAPITEKEINALPAWAFEKLKEALDKQEEEDSVRTIEAKPKNAKGAGPKALT